MLLDLTAFGAWQLVHEFEISRDREIGQAGFAKRNQFRFRELLTWMENDNRPPLILRKPWTNGKCRCIRDSRVAEQYLLDLEGGDIFAPTSDGVFETIDKPKKAGGVANAPA